MKSKLSKREKVMIYIMILVIILGLGFIVVKQLVKRYYAASEAYDSAAFARQNAEMAVANLDQKEANAKELKDYCENNEIALGEAISNTEMEQKVLKYITDCGLAVNSSTITSSYDPMVAITGMTQQEIEDGLTKIDQLQATADASVDGTDGETDEGAVDSGSDMTLTGEDGDTLSSQTVTNETSDTNSGTETDSSTDEAQGSEGLFLTSTFTLELKGTYASFCKFLDVASEKLDIRVESYSVYNETGEIQYSLDSADELIYYVTVSFYMKNQK